MKRIYADNNATTPLHPEVIKYIEEILPYYGNPSSKHSSGREAANYIKKAKKSVTTFFNISEESYIFTSCGSEANNMVLKSLIFNKYDFKPHIIVSSIEHPAVLNTAKFLKKQEIIDLSILDINKQGIVKIEELKNLIKKETVLISVMYANNEIGTIQPIEEIGTLAHKNNILFHSDMVQVAGKIDINLNELPVDFATFSGHKLNAPKGIGMLYFNPDNKKFLIPLIHGGHQESGLRAGTEDFIGICAFGKALEIHKNSMTTESQKSKELRDYFEKEIKSNIPDIIIHGEKVNRLPGTSNISFKYIEGESILLRLDMEGINVSTGSACSSGSLEPSHVITSIVDDPHIAHGSVRFSFSWNNSKKDIDHIIESLKKHITILRRISPLTPN